MYFNVTKEVLSIEGIDALLIQPKDKEKDILLVYYHGWGSSVEASTFRASIFAAAGYTVLVPEEIYHGKRGSTDYDEMYKLPEVLIKNIQEYDGISRYLDENFKGFKRVICGHSLGAFTAMGLLSKEDVLGVIALNGMGDYAVMAKGPYKEALEALNPLSRVKEHVDKAILMLNGELDDSVDWEYQKNYYDAICPIHRGKVPLAFEIIEGTSHVVTTNMMEMSLDFLARL